MNMVRQDVRRQQPGKVTAGAALLIGAREDDRTTLLRGLDQVDELVELALGVDRQAVKGGQRIDHASPQKNRTTDAAPDRCAEPLDVSRPCARG